MAAPIAPFFSATLQFTGHNFGHYRTPSDLSSAIRK
jgi:hypothetical protein